MVHDYSKNRMLPKWKQQIKVYNDGINALETLKSLADKFDGKVINKRFTNACNEIVDLKVVRISLNEMGYNHQAEMNEKRIIVHLSDRSARQTDNDGNYIGWTYVEDSKIEVCLKDWTSLYINADGRLEKDLFINAIDDTIKETHRRIGIFEDAVNNFDTYMEKVEEVNKQLDTLKRDLPTPFGLATWHVTLDFDY